MTFYYKNTRQSTPYSVQVYIAPKKTSDWHVLVHRTRPETEGWRRQKNVFDNSGITPATARGLANSLFLGHLWDVLVACHGGVVGMSHWEATDA